MIISLQAELLHESLAEYYQLFSIKRAGLYVAVIHIGTHDRKALSS